MSFGYQILGFGGGGSVKVLIEATGGTIEEIGDYRVHTFTSTGVFGVTAIDAGLPAPAKAVDYVVTAGGGGGGYSWGGGGGAGGFREAHTSAISGCYTASPITSATPIPISTGCYPVTIGSGGGQSGLYLDGQPGGTSTFSTISSSGGGGGGGTNQGPGNPGGSGGGGGRCGGAPSGSGNSGGYSPAEGNPGGPGTNTGGGGGATASGTGGGGGGRGGDGAATQISETAGINGPDAAFRYYAGGGAPSQNPTGGGVGGGGNSPYNATTPTFPGPTGKGQPGTGGGGKGDFLNTPCVGAPGVVVIRYKYK